MLQDTGDSALASMGFQRPVIPSEAEGSRGVFTKCHYTLQGCSAGSLGFARDDGLWGTFLRLSPGLERETKTQVAAERIDATIR